MPFFLMPLLILFAVDMQIWASLTRSECKVSDTPVTAKACGPLVSNGNECVHFNNVFWFRMTFRESHSLLKHIHSVNYSFHALLICMLRKRKNLCHQLNGTVIIFLEVMHMYTCISLRKKGNLACCNCVALGDSSFSLFFLQRPI